MRLIKEFFNIFIIVRLLKTIKKVIEEAEDRYLSACENNVPLQELDKLEENYKKSLKLMEMLETKSPEKTIKKKS
jgi:hypothetical protein